MRNRLFYLNMSIPDFRFICLNSCLIQNAKKLLLEGTHNESAKLNNWEADPWNLYFYLRYSLPLLLRALISLIRFPSLNALFDNLRDRKGFLVLRRPVVSDLDNEPFSSKHLPRLHFPRGYSYRLTVIHPFTTPTLWKIPLVPMPPSRDSSKFNYSTPVTVVRTKKKEVPADKEICYPTLGDPFGTTKRLLILWKSSLRGCWHHESNNGFVGEARGFTT